jgi:hypothetical protein
MGSDTFVEFELDDEADDDDLFDRNTDIPTEAKII